MVIGRFPKNPVDGTEVSDKYGNRWQYSSEAKTWVSKGVVRSQNLVTEEKNGIINPEIYNRLVQLDQYVKTNTNPDVLKLYPGIDAYWYYLRSSDKLLRFRPEGPSDLRIEIDKGRLFQILLKQICPGVQGPKGPKGDEGRAGRPGPPEICYFPSAIDEARLDFAIFTPVPLQLDGPVDLPNEHVPEVSVRVFAVSGGVGSDSVDQLQHLAVYLNDDGLREFLPGFERTRGLFLQRALGEKLAVDLCDIPLSDVAVFPSGAVVDSVPSATVEISPVEPFDVSVFGSLPVDEVRTRRSVRFDPETNIVCGSVYLLAGNRWADFSDEWCVKSRQKGPDGVKGDSGQPYLRLVECTLDDTNLTAVCPIVNVRLDCDLDVIYTLCTDLLEEACVGLIRLLPSSDVLSDTSALKSVFAAAEMTLDECKRVDRFQIRLESDEVPELELVHWDPQPGCLTRRNYDRHEFNWMPLTDVPACESGATWFGPSAVRPGQYPWEIVFAPEPESDPCCQDDFFWCPNVQDAPLYCPSGTSYVPPPPPPPPPPWPSSSSIVPPSSSTIPPSSSTTPPPPSSSSTPGGLCPDWPCGPWAICSWEFSPGAGWSLTGHTCVDPCGCVEPPFTPDEVIPYWWNCCVIPSSSSGCPSECAEDTCTWEWDSEFEEWLLVDECFSGGGEYDCYCPDPPEGSGSSGQRVTYCCQPNSSSSSSSSSSDSSFVTSSNSNCFAECNYEFCSWEWDGTSWVQIVSCGFGCECESSPIVTGFEEVGDTFSVCCVPISSSSSSSFSSSSSSSSSSFSSSSSSFSSSPSPSIIPPSSESAISILGVAKNRTCGWIWVGSLDDGYWELFTEPCSEGMKCPPPDFLPTEEGQIEYTQCS